MATAEMEPEVSTDPEAVAVEVPPDNDRLLREIAAQEEVVAGRERVVDDLKGQLKEAKDDYEDAVLCLRHLCRAKANDDDRPLLATKTIDALTGEEVADAVTDAPSDGETPAGDASYEADQEAFTEEVGDAFRDAGLMADNGKKKKSRKK